METSNKYYRIAVNKQSEIYSHFEPCGEDLQYAEKEFAKILEECKYGKDTVELQADNYDGNWVTIKSN